MLHCFSVRGWVWYCRIVTQLPQPVPKLCLAPSMVFSTVQQNVNGITQKPESVKVAPSLALRGDLHELTRREAPFDSSKCPAADAFWAETRTHDARSGVFGGWKAAPGREPSSRTRVRDRFPSFSAMRPVRQAASLAAIFMNTSATWQFRPSRRHRRPPWLPQIAPT